MKKWNIYFMIRGPADVTEAPNITNPVECVSLRALLTELSEGLPLEAAGIVLDVIGLRIVPFSSEKYPSELSYENYDL